MRASLIALFPLSVAACLAGCSGRPAAVKPVDIDAGDASSKAMAEYDKSGDGKLDDAELAAVPALLKYKSIYDKNSDGAIDESEIAARIAQWEEQGLGFRQLNAAVFLDGQPLMGAEVELIPEPYLAPSVKPAKGASDGFGIAAMAMAREDMPPQLANLSVEGVTGGTFKVKVTHPSKKIPAKYNTETTLGEEVAFDTVRERITIEMSTR
jgi:hypothetical protein